MAKKPKGPVFLRFLPPVLETLKVLGGSATAGDVTDAVLKNAPLSGEELTATTASGQSRVRNQIGWARFYLSKAGLIQGSQRGVWTLTRKGTKTNLDEQAVLRLFKEVQDQFKKVAEEEEGESPLPDDDDLGTPGKTDDARVEDEKDEGGGEDIHTPYEAAKTHIITKPMSVEQLAKRLTYEEIDLDPGFQRKPDLWTDDTKSRLIESMLIRIPLPAFYFDATDEAKWVVVDGLQRLSTIRHFMVEKHPDKRLKLRGLEYLRQHEGKTFDGPEGLPRDLQRRIEETQVFANLIQPGTPIEVKYNIFKRINTGGLVLTPHEIRHALYQRKGGGGAVQLLRELADSPEFLEATDGAIDKERMLDCEFVLRFVAFVLTPYRQYEEANMDAFLNRHMKRLNDEPTGKLSAELRRRFLQAMRAAQRIFGNDAFRKRFAAGDARKPINKALFETWSVALSNLDAASIEKVVARKDAVQRAFIKVLNEDHEFETSITQGTRDPKRVRKRFSTIESIIDQALKGSP